MENRIIFQNLQSNPLSKSFVYTKRSDFCGLRSNFTLCRLLSHNKRGIGVIFWHFFRGWFSTWLLVVPTHCEIHSWMATIWQFPFHSVMEKGAQRVASGHLGDCYDFWPAQITIKWIGKYQGWDGPNNSWQHLLRILNQLNIWHH